MKGIAAPEMGPKSFGTFVKHAPGHKKNTSILLCELIQLLINQTEHPSKTWPVCLGAVLSSVELSRFIYKLTDLDSQLE